MDTASNIHLAVSQSSVSRCLHEVVNALNEPAIMNAWIKFPRNRNELDKIRTGYELSNYERLFLLIYIIFSDFIVILVSRGLLVALTAHMLQFFPQARMIRSIPNIFMLTAKVITQ